MSRVWYGVLAFLLLAGAACSSSDSTENPSSDADGSGPSGQTAEPEPERGDNETEPADPTAAAPPEGRTFIEGMAKLTVIGPPAGGAGEDPLFIWESVSGADAYDLAVLGPDGPLWSWRGPETEVRMGGLPFERPPGVGGPSIGVASCWSVVALDQEGHVIAASQFLPVAAGESTGHTCTPGATG